MRKIFLPQKVIPRLLQEKHPEIDMEAFEGTVKSTLHDLDNAKQSLRRK
jgi:hypothetical protein